ncbi:MAG: response regulator [bacterium]
MMDNPDMLMKPGDLAHIAQVLPSKITYYTSLGLLGVGEYTEGGQKLYRKGESIVQLKRIEKLTNKGYSLDEIHGKIARNKNEKRILIIDDEPTVGELIKDLLADMLKCDLHIVLDGFAAGLKLQEYFPDLIILDLNLPGVNGFDICRKIRQDELQLGVRILAITGYDSEENYRRIIECGADDYLPKPFHAEEVLAKIFTLLRIKKYLKKRK